MPSAQQPEHYGVTRVTGPDDKGLVVAGYDSQDDMVKVKSVQKKFRDSFTAAQVRVDYWDTAIGAGGSLTQSAGTLTMGSGTTANAVTSILSKQTFTVPFRLSIGLTLSQRIADQTFIAEMVSVDPATGVPDGQHAAALHFDGVTATLAKYVVQNGGITPLISAAVAFASTASNGVYELEPFADESWFHSGTLDATTGRVNSYRRHQQIPDPNALYKIRLRWLNGAVAPASNTNATIQYLAVQDYAELTAEITAGRGQTTAGQGLGVNIIGTPAFFVTGQAAHDAVVTGNPVRVGARALSAAYATVATGDSADLVSTLQGVLVTRPWQIPELEWAYASAAGGIINTTDVALQVAAGAGLRRYITSMQLKNTSAVATEVVLKDGATVIWRGHLSASMTLEEQIDFPNPLKTTAATALNFACITTAAAVYVNAQGYTAA
jgi:hypothetical protein